MDNFLRKAYELFWVPLFGRVLMLFARLIEGKTPDNKSTYDLRSDTTDDTSVK